MPDHASRTSFEDPAEPAAAFIRLEGLTKRYPGQREPAVRELFLDVPEGETVVLVGPSGCGKTTTLRLINRLIAPDEGRILVGGVDVSRIGADELRRGMGYVIQQIGLFPHMTVAENVSTVPRMLRWPAERITERVDELLDTVGLEPAAYRGRFPRELSGGQQQRVGVARAMAADPPVLLMDEPFGSIDPVVRERLQDELLALQRRLRKTILFVTHDIDEAVKMGDRLAVMDHGGTVEQYGSPAEVLSAPASDFVREFVGPGATLKALGLARVRDLPPSTWPILPLGAERSHVRERDPAGGDAGRPPGGRRRPAVVVGDRRGARARPRAGCPDRHQGRRDRHARGRPAPRARADRLLPDGEGGDRRRGGRLPRGRGPAGDHRGRREPPRPPPPSAAPRPSAASRPRWASDEGRSLPHAPGDRRGHRPDALRLGRHAAPWTPSSAVSSTAVR